MHGTADKIGLGGRHPRSLQRRLLMAIASRENAAGAVRLLAALLRHQAMSDISPLSEGGFKQSAQHLLILRGEEVRHGDVSDLVLFGVQF